MSSSLGAATQRWRALSAEFRPAALGLCSSPVTKLPNLQLATGLASILRTYTLMG
jgi:hypothetical protein